MSLNTLKANLRHATRNKLSASIGGGEFSSPELAAALAQIETVQTERDAALLALQNLYSAAARMHKVAEVRLAHVTDPARLAGDIEARGLRSAEADFCTMMRAAEPVLNGPVLPAILPEG